MRDGVTKSIFAHFIPTKGVDFSSFEKVVKIIVKDLDNFVIPQSRVSVRQRGPILGWERGLGLDVEQETSAEGVQQSNGAAESSVIVVKGHFRSIKLAVESVSGADVPTDHDLLTWLVIYATSRRRPFSFGWQRKELVVNKRLIIQNSAAPTWRHSW